MGEGGSVAISFYRRRVDVLGRHVTDPDWARGHSDRPGVNRDRCLNGALEAARSHPDEAETPSAAEHRDFRG